MAASDVASVSAVFFEKSGELVFKLGSRKDQLDVSLGYACCPLDSPVPAPKRESRWSASQREVGHRDVVKFPGHDLVVLVFVDEWRNVFFLKCDGGRVSIACTLGEVKPLKDALGENEFKNLLGEFHRMSTMNDRNVPGASYP